MAKVAVYNMEGKEVDSIELNDSIFGVEINEHLVHMAVLQQLANNRHEHRKLRHVLKFAVAEENHGDRRELVMQDRDLQELHSGQAAELYSLQYQEITLSSLTRRKREQH